MDAFTFFVGTYARRGGQGVYLVRLDRATGVLSAPALAAEAPNCTFLALSPDRGVLYAVAATPATVTSFRVAAASGALQVIRPAGPAEGNGPCHVAVDRTGRMAVTVNFHMAKVASMPIESDGATGAPHILTHAGRSVHPTRQASAHPHSATIAPDNRFALICDLGLDRIFAYRLDPAAGLLTPGSPPFTATEPGAGPRHLAFGPGGKRLYCVNEISNTVAVYDYEPGTGALARRQILSTLPHAFSGESSAAEVALHPNGKFLYASNRGHDSIALFSVDPATGELSQLGHFDCGGKAPRNFALSSDGLWLVCAHQDSDTLCSFGVDASTGRLARVPGIVPVPAPTCVRFLD